MATTSPRHIATCLALTEAISKSQSVEGIYTAALDALRTGVGVTRASILLFDRDDVMRFKAYRGLSARYREAVEGHSPWRPDSPDPQPFTVGDVTKDLSLANYLPVIADEGIAAMAFIPLVSRGRVIGKFMLYYPEPTLVAADDLQLAGLIGAQVAFAVERTRTEVQARQSEERLRFALEAASMGTWDWDLVTNQVVWSDNLARIHGLADGVFDGTFESYAREIHPDDRDRVFASIRRALDEGVPHDVEYRMVTPDGTVQWCEGKGRVEYADGRPARMTGVCMNVTRRKEAELAKLASAEEASRLKDDFLATLSHELRTPLNVMLGWVQMLQAGELPEARTRQAIDVIGRNAHLQARLIEDILDVSRIITGKLELERGPLLLDQLVEAVIADLAPTAVAKGVALHHDISDHLPPISGDTRRLHQVINNVLSNAVKFTPPGGTIHLRCTAEADVVSIEVRDTGVGIDPEFLPYVFDRFRQADSRTTRSSDGLGLGLAIAHHLVQRHNGEILVESEGTGRGTTTTIRLPVPSSPPTPCATHAPRSASAERLDDVAILVVDDQHDSREMLAILLMQHGAVVAQSEGAEQAQEVLAGTSFDVVIADIGMPQVDGYEFMRRLRAAGNGTPAIAVTAFARPDDQRHAFESGYTAYLSKPIDASRLCEAIRRVAPVGASASDAARH